MLAIEFTTQFRKDLKRAQKRGKALDEIKNIMELISKQKSLPAKTKDHFLKGNWKHHRECHINPDWLLIYKILDQERVVIFVRTGSHADLFE